MSKSQFLTYLYGAKYSTNPQTFRDYGKDVPNSWPCRQYLYRGNKVQTAGGIQWWGESFGSDNLDAALNDKYPFKKSMTSKGLHYWMNTSTNGKQTARWFDIGTMGGRAEGDVITDTSESSWMRDVTGVWFLFNANDTTQTRDCYARIEHVAIRYADKDGKVRIMKVTEKLGEISYMAGHRGTNRRVFGYQLNDAGRSIVLDDRNDYKFIGIRVQFQLRRGASGTSTDTVMAGMTSLAVSLGDCDNDRPIYKHVLVPAGDETWGQYRANRPRVRLETR